MHILDDQKLISKQDASGMRNSIAELYHQAEQTYREFKNVSIPKDYKNVNKVVINGMGGSSLGGHIIKSLFKNELKVPLEVINSYHFPNYLDNKTLYIVFSYSGNTEEPLSTIDSAIKRKSKIFCVSEQSGKLVKIAKAKKLPYYSFEEKYNPCGQPRMGLGYSIFSQLLLFNKLGLIIVSGQDFKKVINLLKNSAAKLNPSRQQKNNLAKKIASSIHPKIPLIVASEHLRGNAHAFANQINENAKQLSNPLKLPEINHHLLEGLRFPGFNKKDFIFIFIFSKNYFNRDQIRFRITSHIVKKQGFEAITINLKSAKTLFEAYEMLILGSYVSFYLAMLNRIDPSPIPWVDYFKNQLSKY